MKERRKKRVEELDRAESEKRKKKRKGGGTAPTTRDRPRGMAGGEGKREILLCHFTRGGKKRRGSSGEEGGGMNVVRSFSSG